MMRSSRLRSEKMDSQAGQCVPGTDTVDKSQKTDRQRKSERNEEGSLFSSLEE